jgi:hypothetical protein
MTPSASPIIVDLTDHTGTARAPKPAGSANGITMMGTPTRESIFALR